MSFHPFTVCGFEMPVTSHVAVGSVDLSDWVTGVKLNTDGTCFACGFIHGQPDLTEQQRAHIAYTHRGEPVEDAWPVAPWAYEARHSQCENMWGSLQCERIAGHDGLCTASIPGATNEWIEAPHDHVW